MKPIAEIASEFSRYGQEAVDHMAELLERTPDEFRPALIRFAHATAKMVPEFNGKPAEEWLYNCPECLDTDAHPKGWVIVTEWSKLYRREIERVAACQRCPRGVSWEAAYWLDIVSPKSDRGKRVDSESGWRRFNNHFRERIRRRDLVLTRLRAFQGQQRRPGEEG